MHGLGIFFIFLVIFLVIVVFYYYQFLLCSMCLDCRTCCGSMCLDCRTCCGCERKEDEYNSVDPTAESNEEIVELSEEELSDEETIVQSPEISNFKKLSLSLHF